VPPHERRALETAEVRTTPSEPADAGSEPRGADAAARFVSIPTTVPPDDQFADAGPAATPTRPDVTELPPLMESTGDQPELQGGLELMHEGEEPTEYAAVALGSDELSERYAGSGPPPEKTAPITNATEAADAAEASPPPAKESPAATAESERITRTIFDLHTIYFKTDSVEITPASRELLDENARMLVDNRAVSVVIEGHTDAAGSPRYNQELSKRRAEAVADYLVARNVARDRLEIAVYGEERPLDASETPAARAKNRRVQFLVYYPELGPAPRSSAPATP
jgi:outer membrane protein OmpA-like peptidoglycan-associated protein